MYFNERISEEEKEFKIQLNFRRSLICEIVGLCIGAVLIIMMSSTFFTYNLIGNIFSFIAGTVLLGGWLIGGAIVLNARVRVILSTREFYASIMWFIVMSVLVGFAGFFIGCPIAVFDIVRGIVWKKKTTSALSG